MTRGRRRGLTLAMTALVVTGCSDDGDDLFAEDDAVETTASTDAVETTDVVETTDPVETTDVVETTDTAEAIDPDETDDGGFDLFDPDAEDFADEAEDFIADPDDAVATQLGITFSEVECDAPASTDLGAVFECRALGDDGVRYVFTAEVDGERSFQITAAEPDE